MSILHKLRRIPVRLAALVLLGLLVIAGFSLVNLGDLDHVSVAVLSGPEEGNYYAIVERIADGGRARGAVISNQPSRGTVDNLQVLTANRDDCYVHFGLVQNGVPAPDNSNLELIARLKRSESVFFVGRSASQYTRFAQLSGQAVGIGPRSSGTDFLARRLLGSADFQALGIRLENHGIEEQLAMLASGQLAMGVFVLDDNAELIRDAVRDRGLELASFEHLDALANKFPFVSRGTVFAGQFDPVRVLPSTATPVLRVDTLILGNGCASRTETMGLLSLFSEHLPGFMEHNKLVESAAGYRRSSAARDFFENDGPGFTDQYLPWLVDIMPLGSWFYLVMIVSVLFNAMNAWHRFRLWRIDANRDRAHQIVRDVLGAKLTPEEIRCLEPSPEMRSETALANLDRAMGALDALRAKCRAQQNSILVPMGQEWIYRYEEEQMEAILTALRTYRARAAADNSE